MNKQLKLTMSKEKLKRSLLAITEKRDALASRRAALEAPLERAAELSDEELAKLEADVDALDAEEAAENLDEQSADLERQIGDIEKELDEIGKPAPAQPTENERSKGDHKMNIRTNNRRLALREQIRPIINDESVVNFVEQFRSKTNELSVRGIVNGDLAIPDILTDPLREVVEENSKLYKHVSVSKLKGRARLPIMGTIPEAVWTEMAGCLNELEDAFHLIEFDGYEVGGFIPAHNYILEDAVLNLVVEIITTLGRSIGLALDKAIVYGGGIKQPLGIIPRLASATAPRDFGQYAPTYTDLSATHIGYLTSADLQPVAYFAELAAGLAKAESKYGDPSTKFWAMNSATYTALKIKMLSMNAVGAIVSGVNGPEMPVVGGVIETLEFMPDNVIAGGYGNLYKLVEREGTYIAYSDQVRFLCNQTVFKGFARYDGAPVIGEGFAMFTLSASGSGATEIQFAEDVVNKSDAYLTALSGTGLTLSPTFDKGILAYTASVANAVSSTTITATARTRGKATIKVGGQATTGGVCALSVGANTITVDVVYGTSKQTYTIVVTRAAS